MESAEALSRADLDGHAGCGGETGKSWLFCAGNFLGLNQTDTQRAQEARTFYEYNPQYDAKGNLVDPTKLSDAQVIKEFQDYNHRLQQLATAETLAMLPERMLGVYVNLADQKAQTHILEGDATGGGHRAGTGIAAKSEFPSGWTDQRILHDISE